MHEIIRRATVDTPTTIASLVAVILFAGLLYLLLRSIADGATQIWQATLRLFRHTLKEVVGGPGVSPAERINGLIVLALVVAVFLLLTIIAAQSVRAMIAGGEPPAPMLVATLLVFAILLVGSGLTCVRYCLRQSDDLAAARRHTKSPKL